ncbi:MULTISPECIES: OmpA family protein [Reichenbachiella]|uniref:OmpA family protein n=1 Tax=Reichenbachiella TaxID=156993 RepID=UPI000E6B9BCF|nr:MULTISPECIES: OmpA family protein [Reichenbachiella]MBU2914668.1 OmpA family protein [Reichenbachiella agariperforans]RJE71592.1 hypothetical protein BGP76_05740 [Reichenbachiella sp. MSK19-1]
MKVLPPQLITLLLFIAISTASLAQQNEKLIRITGTVIDPNSNEPIQASVFYEKLPYYDDMGISSTNQSNGVYEFSLIENQKYIITVKADGYKPISEEFEVIDKGVGLIEKNFKMQPDAMHEKISLDNLIFSRGKADISEESYTELDDFADWLEKRPNAVVQLEGHTDFQGNAEANMRLSEERVLAVKEYLTKKGIKKSRIKTKAFGGTEPLTRERTPEARAKNRRVEVRIIQQ